MTRLHASTKPQSHVKTPPKLHARTKPERDASPRQRAFLKWNDRISGALARVNRRMALAYGSAIGRTAARLHLYGANPRDVTAIFGPLPYRRCVEIAQEVSAAKWMNRITSRLVQQAGYDEVRRLVDSSCDERLLQLHRDRQPTILAFMHSGPLLGMTSTLHHLEIPALVLTQVRHHRYKTALDVFEVGESHRLAFKRALDKLRDGGMVLWNVDTPSQAQVGVPFFGQELAFARGPFAAVRLTGAQLVPFTTSWQQGGRIEVRMSDSACLRGQTLAHSKQDALALDTANAIDATAWFERHYRTHPEQISLELLRRLRRLTPDSAGGV